jgi:copper(I)-binding protein
MKQLTFLITIATFFFFTINNLIQAQDHKNITEVGGLIISNIWAPITPTIAKTGATFFIVKNNSKTDDTLVGVSSEVAKKTEIHQSSMKNNIMKMRHVNKVDLPASSVTELKPGSFHIMFIDLYAPIKKGDLFPLTLTFKTAGTVKIMVKASTITKNKIMNHTNIKAK